MGSLDSLIRRVVSLADDATGDERTRELSATHTPASATALVVEATNGAIDVHPTDGGLLTVDAVAKTRNEDDDLDAVSLDVTETGDTIRVAPVLPDDTHGVSVTLAVGVPDGLALERAETKNGRVAATDLTGDPTLVTKNGTVEATRVAGAVTAETTNGTIALADSGIATARSKNGRVDVALDAVDDDVTVETTNGRVTLRLAENVDARVDLATDVGTVDVDRPLDVDSSSRTHVTGTLGDGGPTVTTRAKRGRVSLTGR